MTNDIITIQNEISISTKNTIEYTTNGSNALNPVGIDQAREQYIFAMGAVFDLELQKETDKKDFKLSQEQKTKFNCSIKNGLYKQLHKEQMLTDRQLKQLLDLNKS